MPTLARASPDKELARLIRLFLKAETDIINEIGRLRSRGLVDYHAVAALERVQAILRSLENDCWTYVPRMIEAQFYVHHPETRAVPGETVAKHRAAYLNAQSLTSTQTDIVQRLTMNLMGQLTDGNLTVMTTLQSALLGRIEPDVYRRVGLEQVAAQAAAGRGINQSVPAFVEALRREGVTAFVDKAGRKWSLHTYATIVSRSTSRQAEILSILTQDPDHDLYQISTHGTTCGLCAPYEGRVYSRSGKDPDFPPLSDAFGKMDPSGPSDLTNSWLNIHPNCLHALRAWTPAGRSPEELERIKQFSNPKTNPYSHDPRIQAQIDAYRAKEKGRAQWLRDYRQWENYRTALGDKVPRTFATFQKHKQAGDEKYQGWVKAYRNENRTYKDALIGTIVPTSETVQSIPFVKLDGMTIEQAASLQNAHKSVLQAVLDSGTPDHEAGCFILSDYTGAPPFVSKAQGSIDFPATPINAIGTIHSHPTGYMFSMEDISAFTMNGDLSIMTVVGNNGKIYVLQKTDFFDVSGYSIYLNEQIEAHPNYRKTAEGYISFMEEVLNGARKYGFTYQTY